MSDLSERLRAATSVAVPPPPPEAPEPRAEPLAKDPVLPEGSVELTGGLRAQMDRFESALLLRALREARGSQVEVARLLDIPLRTLQHRLKAHGIRRAGYEGSPPKS